MSISKKFILIYSILLILGTLLFEIWEGNYTLLPDIVNIFVLTVLFFSVIYFIIIKPIGNKLRQLSQEVYNLPENNKLDLPNFSEPELQDLADAVSSAAYELRQQKNMLDWILDHIPAGVVIYQPNIVYANQYALEHLSLDIKSMHKVKPVDFLAKHIDEKTKKQLYLLMKNRIKGIEGRKSYNTELYVNGQTLHVFAVSDTIEYNGKPAGIITFIDMTELRWAEFELTLLQRYLPVVAYHVTITKEGEKFYYISNAIEELTGFTPEEVKSQQNWWYQHVHPDDKECINKRKEKFIKNEKFQSQYRILRKDGTYIWINEQIVILENNNGVKELAGFWRDSTREKIWQFAHNALAKANEGMLRAKSESLLFKYICKVLVDSGFCCYAWIGKADLEQDKIVPLYSYPYDETYASDITITLNQELLTSLGPTGEVASKKRDISLNTDTRTNENIKPWREEMIKRKFFSSAAINIDSDKNKILTLNIYADLPGWFDETLIPLLTTLGRNIGFALSDLNSRERLKYLSYHDSLCGILNINALKSRLLTLKQPAAIAVINIRDFSTVNLNFGYSVGNSILCRTATVIKSCVAKKDKLYHLGGDKFALLVINADKKCMEGIAKRIQKRLAEGVVYENHSIPIFLRIGIAATPEDCSDPTTLHELGMSALNFGNSSRSITKFEPWMQEVSRTRLMLESTIHKAINEESFELYYQPIVNSSSGKVTQCEALIRLNDQDGKPIRPDLMISVAEDLGLITQITRIIIKKVLLQQKIWRSKGVNVRVAVNISAADIEDPEFFPNLQEMLLKNGLNSDIIALEITERTTVEKTDVVRDFIDYARSIGIAIEIDDFGVAHSSLHEISQINFDILKIDKSFIDRILIDERNAEIVRFIIHMATQLQAQTVAEGVEKQEQIDWLKDNGCDFIQGYIYSKPLPTDEFEAWYNVHKK
ncbi:bifunctional diguanylate cyclase/phosphodiesterase [Hydrogenimonas thermophila]|uniref:PAS domain S-box-containing protein/diguanylate cyclase (GGDEF) domain-containing protein n=1 Tax=Hydrogenimonas thermophila TaxID=223786 RepID=A0A1I5QD06_9BACT|nr:bifunctional diguanylate cyclase/phosphodiesterase [Hydrogenimonas thermophila]SFP44152.1 PAS domain S-box-containing protein/diguanylate cyclase (GGDEF) domain-containing protein [Hydrogenimonas thermophila]